MVAQLGAAESSKSDFLGPEHGGLWSIFYGYTLADRGLHHEQSYNGWRRCQCCNLCIITLPPKRSFIVEAQASNFRAFTLASTLAEIISAHPALARDRSTLGWTIGTEGNAASIKPAAS